MPAISADTVALPRIPTVDPTAAARPVVSVTTAPSGFEGEGFPVRRVHHRRRHAVDDSGSGIAILCARWHVLTCPSSAQQEYIVTGGERRTRVTDHPLR